MHSLVLCPIILFNMLIARCVDRASIALRGKLNKIWTGKNLILGEGLLTGDFRHLVWWRRRNALDGR